MVIANTFQFIYGLCLDNLVVMKVKNDPGFVVMVVAAIIGMVIFGFLALDVMFGLLG